MRLIVDENLSPALAHRLGDIFPSFIHVRDIGMKRADDFVIWEYAKANDLIIVSKDADMHDLSLVFGNPPKVLWIKLGNCSSRQVETLIRTDYNVIKLFHNDDEVSLLRLH